MISQRRPFRLSVALATAVPWGLAAQPADLVFVPDRAVRLPAGIVASHKDFVQTNRAGDWGLTWTGLSSQLPPGAAIDAYSEVGTTIYFSLDRDALLPAAGPVADEDILVSTQATNTIAVAWDGSANGLPAGANLDAVSVADPQAPVFLLSFDRTVLLPGVGPVADEDVVSWSAGSPGVYTLFLDGSAAGLPVGADLVGVAALPNGNYSVGLDRPVTIGSTTFDAGDVLEYQFAAPSGFQPTPFSSASTLGLPSGIQPGAIETFDNGPLLVDLIAFEVLAPGGGGRPRLRWETALEVDNAGFHLYRGIDKGGVWVPGERMTRSIIPGRGTDFTGAVYTFEDPDPWLPGAPARAYLLEDVEFGGNAALHGPAVLDVARGQTRVHHWRSY